MHNLARVLVSSQVTNFAEPHRALLFPLYAQCLG